MHAVQNYLLLALSYALIFLRNREELVDGFFHSVLFKYFCLCYIRSKILFFVIPDFSIARSVLD